MDGNFTKFLMRKLHQFQFKNALCNTTKGVPKLAGNNQKFREATLSCCLIKKMLYNFHITRSFQEKKHGMQRTLK